MPRWILTLTALAYVVAGCGAGKAVGSQATLVERLVTAVKAGDVERAAGLLMTIEQAKALCPEMDFGNGRVAGQLLKEAAKVAEDVGVKCKAFDWANAKQVSITGGEEVGTNNKCPGIVGLRDIKIHYNIGGKHIVIKIDEPGRSVDGKQWFMGESPRCRAVDGPAPMSKAETFATVKAMSEAFVSEACACETKACASKKLEDYASASAALTEAHVFSEAEGKPIMAIVKRGTTCLSELPE
ncbi:MAG: hypothetical protein ACI9MR_002905 [Myxococcota bacterium]|jgi:hypothetical protein